ncbi:MAG: YihY/virulence factor BrkB family protein [Gemmatimonadales bacterium]|nr:YihY/virulence factor BrkB family protein [Myxococcales bacterium]
MDTTPSNIAKPKKWRSFVRALRREWAANKLTDAAAALTFYGILALFPFVLFIVAAASLIIRPEQVQALGDALARDTPPALAPILLARLGELTSRPRVGVLTFSALAAVWSSTTGVTSLVTALNSAYGVSERRPRWKVYTMAFAVMLGATLLALLAALLAVVVPIAARQLGASWQPLVGWLRLPVATFLMMIVWATIYYVLPNVTQTVRLIMPGSVAGVIGWLAATLVFSFYVSQFGNFGITYGALGGIVILLVWMWLSSLALMLGAEVNAVLRRPPDDGHPREYPTAATRCSPT